MPNTHAAKRFDLNVCFSNASPTRRKLSYTSEMISHRDPFIDKTGFQIKYAPDVSWCLRPARAAREMQ